MALLVLVSCGDKENADEPIPSAPATPTGLALKSATKTSLTFKWDAVSGASAYEWRLLEDGTQKFTNLVETPDAVVESLSPGTTYSFSVRSIVDGLKSSWSSSVTATTESDTEYYAQFAILPLRKTVSPALSRVPRVGECTPPAAAAARSCT